MSNRSGLPHVILADDHEGIRNALTCLLRPVCNVVGHVSLAAELLPTIERLRADIVVLDLNMPGIDGLYACRQVKTAAPDVDVIVCTATDDSDLRARALEAGASAFVSKFRMGDDLVAAIQRIRSHRAAEELRDLRGRLIDAQEQERHRLSRELHDGVGQRLAILSAEVASLREVLAGSPPLLERVRRLLTHTEEIGTELHRVSLELLPVTLERLGLAASIRRVCTELSDVHRIAIHLEIGKLPAQMSQNVVLCLYRIAQEALRNVVKHSNAATASVRLEADADDIVLHVIDDGLGFDPAHARELNGLGLVNMRERAHHAGGDVTLTAKPGHGTRVQVRVPLAGSEFTLSGDGLCVGWDSGDAVSQECKTPGRFKGGTILAVAVTTEKAQYLTLQQEVRRVMKVQ